MGHPVEQSDGHFFADTVRQTGDSHGKKSDPDVQRRFFETGQSGFILRCGFCCHGDDPCRISRRRVGFLSFVRHPVDLRYFFNRCGYLDYPLSSKIRPAAGRNRYHRFYRHYMRGVYHRTVSGETGLAAGGAAYPGPVTARRRSGSHRGGHARRHGHAACGLPAF